MSIIVEKIKKNNQDVFLNINLKNNNDYFGYQEEINNITEETKKSLINPVIDNEIVRFRYYNQNIPIFKLYFNFIANSGNPINSFLNNGARFTSDEINSKNNVILNSFFIIDLYDDFNYYTQSKIFTTYNTKIINNTNTTPIYDIGNDIRNQFCDVYIPKYYIDKQTGDTINMYIKYSFYNAKYGDICIFYDEIFDNQEKLYFNIVLDLNNNKWKFNNNKLNGTANQLPFNYKFSEKTNDGITNFNNKKQIYPIGNSFNRNSGKYDNI